MTLHLRATGCYLLYEITQCYLSPHTSEHTPPYPSETPVEAAGPQARGQCVIVATAQLSLVLVYTAW